MKKEDPGFPELLLFGGPLQKLGAWLRLTRGETGAFRLGLALSLPAWIVLIGLAFLHGPELKVFSLPWIGVHIRLLLVIPLFFACEKFVGPVIAEFARNLRESGLVGESEWPALAMIIRRVRWLANGWAAELLLFLLAFGAPLYEAIAGLPGGTLNWSPVMGKTDIGSASISGWYLMYCMPLFRFLAFRWLWRLGLWWYFLWRLKKLDLQLVATHSDGAGGLGFLAVVQEHFVPLVLAISGAFSASFAEAILQDKMKIENLYSLVPGVLVLVFGLFIGPLALFVRRLWDCRVNGLDKYMAMASRYVQAFERKWIRDAEPTGDSQLGTSDLQSLADLTNSLNVVRGIRMLPGGPRLALWLGGSVIGPMLPLVLLKYPVDQVAKVLLKALIGL
jgi:hypothetical protein